MAYRLATKAFTDSAVPAMPGPPIPWLQIHFRLGLGQGLRETEDQGVGIGVPVQVAGIPAVVFQDLGYSFLAHALDTVAKGCRSCMSQAAYRRSRSTGYRAMGTLGTGTGRPLAAMMLAPALDKERPEHWVRVTMC